MATKSILETEFYKNWSEEKLVENAEIITAFYEAFARHDAEQMVDCYHDEIQFTDPAFGTLKGDEAKDMWRMLIKRAKGSLKIQFENVTAKNERGSADWVAEYLFSQTGRNVINKIHAEFEFRDGKIIRHVDDFDVWKWSSQALGISGQLLGWSSFMKNKIQQRAKAGLREFRKTLNQ